MANNLAYKSDASATVGTVATDDVAGVHYQYIKHAFGPDDTATLVTASVGLPVAIVGTVTVDGSGVTQPVSGTVTANLSATDNAVLDTINAAVVATQAAVEGTLTVTGGGGGTEYTEDVATANPIVGTATLMERDDALTTITPVEGDWAAFRCSAEGALWVQDFNSDAIAASLAGTLTVDGSGVTQPVSGTVTANLSATDNAVLDTINTAVVATQAAVEGTLTVGSHAVTNAGTFAVQVDAALPAGTNAIGKLAANSGVDIGDVDVLSVAAGSNLVGDVGISGARTSGGATTYHNDGTASLTQVKASAGQVYSINAQNLTASVVYLQIFGLASASVTLGTTVPNLQYAIPTQGDTNGTGFTDSLPNGWAMASGISYAFTTTKSGATPISADEAMLNLGYA